MGKVGRNDPCLCGSEKKFKKCCQGKEQQKCSHKKQGFFSKLFENFSLSENVPDQDSNRIIDLIKDGKLDEAEKAAHKLIIDYPEIHDGLERLAAVYEAKGNFQQALEMYQKALDFVKGQEGYYDDEFSDFYRNKIVELKKKGNE